MFIDKRYVCLQYCLIINYKWHVDYRQIKWFIRHAKKGNSFDYRIIIVLMSAVVVHTVCL